MRSPLAIFCMILFTIISLNSCVKQEYLKSEKAIKKDLQGTWFLIPIPRYDTIWNPDLTYNVIEHSESWTFDDTRVTIKNNNLTSTSTYSVNTSLSKAEFNLDGITPEFIPPARVRSNGKWQIVKLDGSYLIIASDKDGASGLTQLEFHK
jgi:hypothetical protein